MKISFLRDIEAQQRSLRDYSKTYARSKYCDEAKPWNERCGLAFACALQNEINQPDAINLVNSGCRMLAEGSNMPCACDAVDVMKKASVLIAPAMAAGAGGALFDLRCREMGQVMESFLKKSEIELNHECSLMHWSPEDFESKLQDSYNTMMLEKYGEDSLMHLMVDHEVWLEVIGPDKKARVHGMSHCLDIDIYGSSSVSSSQVAGSSNTALTQEAIKEVVNEVMTSFVQTQLMSMLEPILYRIVGSQARSGVSQALSQGDIVGEDHEVDDDDNGANLD